MAFAVAYLPSELSSVLGVLLLDMKFLDGVLVYTWSGGGGVWRQENKWVVLISVNICFFHT